MFVLGTAAAIFMAVLTANAEMLQTDDSFYIVESDIKVVKLTL